MILYYKHYPGGYSAKHQMDNQIPGEIGPDAQIPGERGPPPTSPVKEVPHQNPRRMRSRHKKSPAKEVTVAKIPGERGSRRKRFPVTEVPGDRGPVPVQIFPRRMRSRRTIPVQVRSRPHWAPEKGC